MTRIGRQYIPLLLLLHVAFTPTKGQEQSQIDSLLYIFEASKNDSTRVKALIDVAYQYASTNLSLSFHYANEALKLSEHGKNKQNQVEALIGLGNICFYQGLLDISLKHYQWALGLCRELGDNKSRASILTNLGGVLLQLKKFDEAKEYFHEALEILSDMATLSGDTTPPYQLISIYNNLGIVHDNLGDYPRAIDYYHRGIGLYKHLSDDKKNVAMLYNNLGGIHVKMGEYEQAFRNMDIALKIRRELNDKSGEASSYRMLGILYKTQNRYNEALETFYRGYSLAAAVGSTAILSSICDQLFDIYNARHQSDSALKYHILLKEFSDRIKAEETMREFTRMEIVSQQREQEQIRLIEQRKQTLRHAFVAIVLLLLVVILGLLYFLSQSRLRRMNLKNRNIKLASEKMALEKEAMALELEVKNKELTTNVIYQIRRNELIGSIAERLLAYSHNFKKENQQLIKSIIEDLENTQEDSVWEEFETRFHQVHNKFYKKLNDIHPNLSPNERKLCAFLRLNMSTKEISSITGQSFRSIEVARTRLRKKLDLTNSDIGLIEYLSNI